MLFKGSISHYPPLQPPLNTISLGLDLRTQTGVGDGTQTSSRWQHTNILKGFYRSFDSVQLWELVMPSVRVAVASVSRA